MTRAPALPYLPVLVVGDDVGTWVSAAGFRTIRCTALADAAGALAEGTGAVVLGPLAREGPAGPGAGSDWTPLAAALARQPDWSDVPVIVCGAEDDDALLQLGNVVFVDPDPAAVARAVRTALRARGRQHHVRDTLLRTEQRFAGFMAHLPGLAWMKTMDGRYAYVNDAAAKAFQHPREAIVGHTDEELFPPETAALFRRNDELALATEGGLQTIETLEHDDGIVHHSIVAKFAVPGADGNHQWIGGMAIDVTDRLRAEQALREADRRKDEFLAVLSHELRNPLAAISNALWLLRRPGGGGAQIFDVLDRQVRHLVRLVDDLLEVSRITRGRIELRREAVRLDDALRSALETCAPVLEAGGHAVHLDLPVETVPLDADPVRLAQVFTNLLHNAARYSDPGAPITVTARRTGREVSVHVRDQGVGIAPDQLPRVFDVFWQGHRTRARASGGLGIGLTLVQVLVGLHGGRVEARSEGVGLGSEFVVTLPVAELPDAAPGPERAPSTPRTVLVVDDNADAANTLAMLLHTLGHAATVAFDGPSALEAALRHRPDVVLLDLGMPGMDGYEVARRLREAGLVRARIVAVTGYGSAEHRARALAVGFDEHLVKPIDAVTLTAVVAGE